jgi:hypothetical protein
MYDIWNNKEKWIDTLYLGERQSFVGTIETEEACKLVSWREAVYKEVCGSACNLWACSLY